MTSYRHLTQFFREDFWDSMTFRIVATFSWASPEKGYPINSWSGIVIQEQLSAHDSQAINTYGGSDSLKWKLKREIQARSQGTGGQSGRTTPPPPTLKGPLFRRLFER